MHKVNDLPGKQTLDQDTGEKLSSVQEVIFDDDTRRVVALPTDGGILRSPRVVSWSSVANVEDVVAV